MAVCRYRLAGALGAQGAIAAGRVIYDVARRLLRAMIFPRRALEQIPVEFTYNLRA